MRLLLFGQRFWCNRIADAVNARDRGLTAEFVDQRQYAAILARPPRGRAVMLMRVGYRVGAGTTRGRLFDTFWRALKSRVPDAGRSHYWLGTDVLDTLRDVEAGRLRLEALQSVRSDLHFADAPWLAVELATVGIQATILHVPHTNQPPERPPPLPDRFAVLTYLPADRFAFYGGHVILEAARRLPTVRFDIVGSGRRCAQGGSDSNVTWHGFVSDMTARYAGATVVARLPEHDGLGATVVEGLWNAREVIYSYPLPFVHRLASRSADALEASLGELLVAHDRGLLAPNVAGRDWALAAFDPSTLADALIEQILAARR